MAQVTQKIPEIPLKDESVLINIAESISSTIKKFEEIGVKNIKVKFTCYNGAPASLGATVEGRL